VEEDGAGASVGGLGGRGRGVGRELGEMGQELEDVEGV
jgi:hypothetical protein